MNAVTEDLRFNGVREEHVGCLDGGWLIGCGHPEDNTPKDRKMLVSLLLRFLK